MQFFCIGGPENAIFLYMVVSKLTFLPPSPFLNGIALSTKDFNQ